MEDFDEEPPKRQPRISPSQRRAKMVIVATVLVVVGVICVLTLNSMSTMTVKTSSSDSKVKVKEEKVMQENWLAEADNRVNSFAAFATSHDKITNYCHNDVLADSTVVQHTIKQGKWSDASIWSLGRVPASEDTLAIHHHVTYDVFETTTVQTIGIFQGGTLTWDTKQSSTLFVTHFQVWEGGFLEIGTESKPVPPNVSIDIQIRDKSLDLSHDPMQFGNGLNVLGKIRIFGSSKLPTWVRLARAPLQGHVSLKLAETVTGWRPGDVLVIPDTRQYLTPKQIWSKNIFKTRGKVPAAHWEQVHIASIDGTTITLKEPIRFDHFAGQSKVKEDMTFMPHIGNLSRNIMISSENPKQTRGHVLLTHRADVNIQYARFHALGRTLNDKLGDETQYDEDGTLLKVGTNPIGRYVLHCHYLIGPENPKNEGYQFKLIGNTVDSGIRWGMVLHGSNFGLVENNVVYNIKGSGIVTEDGNEVHNKIINNFVMRIWGNGLDGKKGTFVYNDENKYYGYEVGHDYGRGGVGFWLKRVGNTVTGNVAVNCKFSGFQINSYMLHHSKPLVSQRGEDPASMDNGGEWVKNYNPEVAPFDNNEAYGITFFGFWNAFPHGGGHQLVPKNDRYTFSNLTFWGVFVGILSERTRSATYKNIILLGDRDTVSEANTVGINTIGYENVMTEFENIYIEGFRFGLFLPRGDPRIRALPVDWAPVPTRVTNCEIHHTWVGIIAIHPWRRPRQENRFAIIDNVLFGYVDQSLRPDTASSRIDPGLTWWVKDTPKTIHMVEAELDAAHRALTIEMMEPEATFVVNFNRTIGDNFFVNYLEQDKDFVIPAWSQSSHPTGSKSLHRHVFTREVNKTNQQVWDEFMVAVAGHITPCTSTRPSIVGFCCRERPWFLTGAEREMSFVNPRSQGVWPLYQPRLNTFWDSLECGPEEQKEGCITAEESASLTSEE